MFLNDRLAFAPRASRTSTVTPSERKPKRSAWQAVAGLFVLAFFVLPTPGCTTGATSTLRSESGAGELRATMTVLAYGSTDKNTADVFLSDLPRGALEPDGDLSSVSGQFVHIHVFITPSAGDTPIDSGACSAVVRTVVIARGQLGVYGGGAFLNPSSPPGGSSFSGTIANGTCRLVSGTPGFVDKLGPSAFKASFRVPRNEAMVEVMRKRLGTMLEMVGGKGK